MFYGDGLLTAVEFGHENSRSQTAVGFATKKAVTDRLYSEISLLGQALFRGWGLDGLAFNRDGGLLFATVGDFTDGGCTVGPEDPEL